MCLFAGLFSVYFWLVFESDVQCGGLNLCGSGQLAIANGVNERLERSHNSAYYVGSPSSRDNYLFVFLFYLNIIIFY